MGLDNHPALTAVCKEPTRHPERGVLRYADNYLTDVKFGIIMDVKVSREAFAIFEVPQAYRWIRNCLFLVLHIVPEYTVDNCFLVTKPH